METALARVEAGMGAKAGADGPWRTLSLQSGEGCLGLGGGDKSGEVEDLGCLEGSPGTCQSCLHLSDKRTFTQLLSRHSSPTQAEASSAQDALSQAFCDSTPLARKESSLLNQVLPEPEVLVHLGAQPSTSLLSIITGFTSTRAGDHPS